MLCLWINRIIEFNHSFESLKKSYSQIPILLNRYWITFSVLCHFIPTLPFMSSNLIFPTQPYPWMTFLHNAAHFLSKSYVSIPSSLVLNHPCIFIITWSIQPSPDIASHNCNQSQNILKRFFSTVYICDNVVLTTLL